MDEKRLGIYIHIPFCKKKCNYCDFLSFEADDRTKDLYMYKLKEQIAGHETKIKPYLVDSVFFGGGTPSIIEGEEIAAVMETIYSHYKVHPDAEITIEANPGTLSKEKLNNYRQAGINRLSLGLQSAVQAELDMLGRIHSYEAFLESYQAAREAGFTNINVDLMAALPGQTEASYIQTLRKVISLRPEHISAYSLIIEPGTPFYDSYGESGAGLPAEEEERSMYEKTKQILAEEGYYRYEISNYARPGYECRHNIRYWTRSPYIGFGLGASSFIEETRMRNQDVIEEYLQNSSKIIESESLSGQAQMEEYMFLGLRMTEGIAIADFETCFASRYEDVYGKQTEKLIRDGLIVSEGGRVSLTEKGVDLSNCVLSMFLF